MSKLKIFLTLSGYQLTWSLCIFGEFLYRSYLPGLIGGLSFLIIYFLYSNNKKKLAITVICISTLGYLFDTFLIFFKIYNFETSFNFGLLPIWMIVLWPSFSILFDEILVFFSKYKVIGVLLSSIVGPLTYYSGSPLGLININELSLFIILMIIFWGSLMLFYLSFLLKKIN